MGHHHHHHHQHHSYSASASGYRGTRRSSPVALFILGAICLIGGPAFGFIGYSSLNESKALQANGKRVQGEVMGSYKKTGGKSSSSKTELTVTFTTPEGKEISDAKSVANSVYEKYKVVHDGDVAKTCTVVYDPGSGKWTLEDQIPEDISTYNLMMFGGPLGGLLFALILFGSGIAAARRRTAALAMMGAVMAPGMTPQPYPQAYPQAPQPYPGGPQPYPQQPYPQQMPQAGYPQQPYPQQGQPNPQQPPYGQQQPQQGYQQPPQQ